MSHANSRATEAGKGWLRTILILGGVALGLYVFYPRSSHLLSDKDADFSVRVPSGWTREKSNKSNWAFGKGSGPDKGMILISFEPRPSAPGRPALDDLESQLSRLRQRFPKLVLQDKQSEQVAGLNAYRLTYSFVFTEATLPAPVKAQTVVIWREGVGIYYLTLITLFDSSWPKHAPEFYQLVGSFHAPAESG